jgi:uncharacterized protein YukE
MGNFAVLAVPPGSYRREDRSCCGVEGGEMGSGYEISVQEVLRVAGQLDGLLAAFEGAVRGVQGVTIPVASYGRIGSGAARGTGGTSDQLVQTLQALADSIQQINQRVRASANGYATSDREIAEMLARMNAAMKPVPEIPRR